MKALKIGISMVLLTLILSFAAVMTLPMDAFVAQRISDLKGYETITDYDDANYKYYYGNLSEKEQLAYSLIYAEICDFPEEVLIPDLTDEELQEVFTALSYDNPELFFLGNKCNFTSIGSFNYFIPQYVMTLENYESMLAEVEKKSDEILSAIPKNATSLEKELYIHDYIVRNCEYDYGESDMVYTIYGSIVEGEANCEGYSRAMQYLLKRAGVENYVVTGVAENADGEPEGHMWNVVRIDGESFNLDSTWNDYSLDEMVSTPDNSPSHAYFNVDSDNMKDTHEIDDESMWSDCTTADKDYFDIKGLRFDSCDSKTSSVARKAIADALMSGDCSLEIAFSNEEAYNDSIDYFVEKNNLYIILRAVNEVVPTNYKVDATRIQYSKDDAKQIVRFFFVR